MTQERIVTAVQFVYRADGDIFHTFVPPGTVVLCGERYFSFQGYTHTMPIEQLEELLKQRRLVRQLA